MVFVFHNIVLLQSFTICLCFYFQFAKIRTFSDMETSPTMVICHPFDVSLVLLITSVLCWKCESLCEKFLSVRVIFVIRNGVCSRPTNGATCSTRGATISRHRPASTLEAPHTTGCWFSRMVGYAPTECLTTLRLPLMLAIHTRRASGTQCKVLARYFCQLQVPPIAAMKLADGTRWDIIGHPLQAILHRHTNPCNSSHQEVLLSIFQALQAVSKWQSVWFEIYNCFRYNEEKTLRLECPFFVSMLILVFPGQPPHEEYISDSIVGTFFGGFTENKVFFLKGF